MIIYFDYITGYGVNAVVNGVWDFYPSVDELIHECTRHYGDQFILVSTSVPSGSFIGYKESLNDQ